MFVMPELFRALGKTRNRRGVDKSNIVVEMLKFGGPLLQQKVLDAYNEIIAIGTVPENWHITIFSMLPKSGGFEKKVQYMV